MRFQCGGVMADGSRCPYDADAAPGDVPVCRNHLNRLHVEFGVDGASGPASVVYYIGDPASGLVKIGTSTGLRNRVDTIRRRRPRAIVLATEPGTYPLERQRHGQFSRLHEPLPSGEREWFRKAPVLMVWIGEVRKQHGIICPGPDLWQSMIAPLRS